MKVTYYFREYRKGVLSIETLFNTILNHMDRSVSTARFMVTSSARLLSLALAFFRQGDVNHITGDVNYLALVLKGSKTVMTIHDIGHYEYTLRGWRKFIYKKFWFEWPMKKVAKITTVSEFTKAKLVETFGIDPVKIQVIYNPVPAIFRVQEKPLHEDRFKILQIGSGANKNIERLIEAVKDMPCELILVRAYDEVLAVQLKEANISCSWHFNLSQEEVYRCYVDADIVFFASTYEGFGMPIIEGQAVGRPVITSDMASMPEVGGEGVCLVNPFNVEEIRAAIHKISSDVKYREALIKKGFKNIERFRVDHIVEAYMKVYQEIFQQKHSS
jgi:glycosyltransferase involved in cell wall biosynthesis